MTRRFAARLALAVACTLAAAGTASAQQTLNFHIGAFVPRGEDARVEGDVLNEDRAFLAFDLDDFTGVSVGGEWLAGLGDYFELGAGAGFYRSSVDSVYADFVDRDGTEIEQDLTLRTIPFTATIRMLPLGQRNGFQPYFGAGLQLVSWRYSESGEFIDFTTPGRDLFRESFVADGFAAGPVALAGVRFRGGSWVTGFEFRYTRAEGDLDENDFVAPKIDLGGWNYLFTIGKQWR